MAFYRKHKQMRCAPVGLAGTQIKSSEQVVDGKGPTHLDIKLSLI